MRSIRLFLILLALTGCPDRQTGKQSQTGGASKQTVRVSTPIDPEKLARSMAITRATYDSYKRRSDRVFGETYEDVNWSGPPIRQIRRRSTGDFFRYTQWNGGYPSYLTFVHNGVMLQTDVKGLFVDDHRYEPIYVIGPAYVMTGPDRRTKRDWTSRELYVIASFFQTKYREAHVSNISMLRANGHHEMADANERAPMARPSVIYEKNVDIASIAELPKS